MVLIPSYSCIDKIYTTSAFKIKFHCKTVNITIPFLQFFRNLCHRVRNFLLPGFNSKICLTKGNHFFAGVSVHHNQVTSVTGKLDIGDFTLGPFSEIYHFADVGKMICFDKTK